MRGSSQGAISSSEEFESHTRYIHRPGLEVAYFTSARIPWALTHVALIYRQEVAQYNPLVPTGENVEMEFISQHSVCMYYSSLSLLMSFCRICDLDSLTNTPPLLEY